MRRSSSVFFLASASLLAASAALLAACSDDSSSGSTSTTSTSTGAGGDTTSSSSNGSSSSGNGSASSSSGNGGASASSSSGDGGASASSSSGGGGSGVDDLSDTFDGSSLDGDWQIVNPNAVTGVVSGGSLELTLTKPALWFQMSQGVLVYKSVTGDFKATARVRAFKASNPAQPPAQNVELGGLMARDPAGGPQENYVFIVVGHDENDLSVETKTTVDGVSTYVGPTWPSGEAELRVCRVGADFVLLKRAIGGGAWTEASKYSRPDLPATLQVGPNIYSLSQPDLAVKFDEVTFAPVSGAADCAQD